MKKTLVAAAALLAVTAAPSFADTRFDGAYAGPFVGHESTEFDVESIFLTGEASAKGMLGGVAIGYGRAFGPYYLGAEVGYDYSDARYDEPGFELGFDHSFSVSGRVGYVATPDLMIYGLAGYEGARYDAQLFGDSIMRDWVDGVKLGLGAEYHAEENIFLRGEYSHTFFEKFRVADASVNTGRSVFKAGIGYRF